MLITLIILAVVGVPIVAYLEYSVYREAVTDVEVKNSNGAKSALLIYHPGLTSFAHDVAYTFAEKLASNGWRVEIATASSQAPTDLSNHDLLVLSWPIYDFNLDPPLPTTFIG